MVSLRKKKKENGNLTDGCGRMSTHLPPVRVGAFEEDEPLALGDGHHVVAALVRVAVEDDHRRLASLDGRLHGAPAATDATDAGRPVLVAGPSPPSHGGHQVTAHFVSNY